MSRKRRGGKRGGRGKQPGVSGVSGKRVSGGGAGARRTSGFSFTFFRQPEFAIAVFATLCLALLAYNLVDLSGHDYGYFLPKMLDTHLFYLQNGFGLQEYTAGLCAGIFQFANPQSMALALPQGLSYFFGPLRGIQGTFVFISVLSGGGMYFCARYWGLGKMASSIAAIAMAFNGFLLTRIAIGHLAFYGFGFAPAIAAALLYGIGAIQSGRPGRAVGLGAVAALFIAVLIYGGIGVMLIHTAAAVVLILLICGGFRRDMWLKSVLYCLLWAGLGLLAAAPKIEAVLAMNANLTRDFYPLPGFGFFHTPLVLFESLFWIPDEELTNQRFQNNQFYMGWHEIYYGFTPLLAVALALSLSLGWKRLHFAAAWREHPATLSLVMLALVLALALNVYEPAWNRFIKSLPLLGQFSGMTRFIALFIPVVALFLGWVLNHWKRIPPLGVLLFTGALAFVQYQIVNEHLRPGMYFDRIDLQGRPIQEGRVAPDKRVLNVILSAWSSAREQPLPPLREVAVKAQRQADGQLGVAQTSFNDYSLIAGKSNAGCYEPLFGYRLEQYQLGALQPGAITLEDGAGHLNLKNPACYVYPEANGCAPGDHFKAEQKEQMLALADYSDPQLAVSGRRAAADRIGIAVLLALAGYLLLYGAWAAALSFLRLSRRRHSSFPRKRESSEPPQGQR